MSFRYLIKHILILVIFYYSIHYNYHFNSFDIEPAAVQALARKLEQSVKMIESEVLNLKA